MRLAASCGGYNPKRFKGSYRIVLDSSSQTLCNRSDTKLCIDDLRIGKAVVHVKEFCYADTSQEIGCCYKKRDTIYYHTPSIFMVGGTGIEPVTSTV
jgi:hypothetical protein